MTGIYGLWLLAALAAGTAGFYGMARREGLCVKMTAVLAALAAVLGALCGRLYLHAAKYMVYGAGFEGYTVLSSRPYEYAACGTLLGVLLAGVLSAKLAKQSLLKTMDALAPAGLLALAVARFGEHFSDFGWGPVVENAAFQRFPFAVADIFGQWRLAVYVLEGLLALAVCACALRVKAQRQGDCFLTALLLFAATQIFCESLRTETVRWGFVRVQQLQCAVFMLAVLLAYTLRAKGAAKKTLPAWVLFVLGVGMLVFIEYALDKIDALTTPVCYTMMAATLALMAGMIDGQRRRVGV